MKKLGLLELLKDRIGVSETKVETRGRKSTPFQTRKLIWEFYHSKSTPSTNTTRPAILKLIDLPRIQVGLDFVSTTTITLRRNKQVYENVWYMLHVTYRELYKLYQESNPLYQVSIGTFRALKPFYVRTRTEKDIEMCCCKIHLHARWTIEALIECAQEQSIELPFTDYKSFFEFVTVNCAKHATAYIDWNCACKDQLCSHINSIWEKLCGEILPLSSKEICVDLTRFEMVEYKKKNEEISTKLRPISKSSTLVDIINFLNTILTNIINHRNHLKHYRNVINVFRDALDALFIDIDFSENLKLPYKEEPQSLHWCHDSVTVHSGIVKIHGEKIYHPYISDDKKHDQTFVKLDLEKMISTVVNKPPVYYRE